MTDDKLLGLTFKDKLLKRKTEYLAREGAKLDTINKDLILPQVFVSFTVRTSVNDSWIQRYFF